jgi:predicted DNA-binding transcriptional regulator AlpA
MNLIPYEKLKAKGICYSRMQLRRKERAGSFPARVRLSNARVAWLESEIDAWIVSRPRGIASR